MDAHHSDTLHDDPLASVSVQSQLFLDNVETTVDWTILQEHLQQFGQVCSALIVSTTGDSMSILVTYSSRAGVLACVNNLHSILPLNMLGIRPRAVMAEVSVEQEYKLFVGMLPKILSESEIMTIFSDYGVIKEVHVMRHPSGLSKGCAFVKFFDLLAASKAIRELHGQLLPGSVRPLVVQFAESKNGPGTGTLAAAPEMAASTSVSASTPNVITPPTTVFTRGGCASRPGDPQSNQSSRTIPCGGTDLFIYHLPREVTNQDLETLFEPFGPIKSSTVYVDRVTNLSKGFGFVTFENSEDALAAIRDMDGYNVGPKRLKVEFKK